VKAAVNNSNTTVAAPTPSYSSTASRSDILAGRLDISPHLFKKHGFVSLQHAYEQYKVFNVAHDHMTKMGKDGTWGGKLPLKNDLMEVFASRSTFYPD
jgi:hypothetical protein